MVPWPRPPSYDCLKIKKMDRFLEICVSSLRRGHANLLCIVPNFVNVFGFPLGHWLAAPLLYMPHCARKLPVRGPHLAKIARVLVLALRARHFSGASKHIVALQGPASSPQCAFAALMTPAHGAAHASPSADTVGHHTSLNTAHINVQPVCA